MEFLNEFLTIFAESPASLDDWVDAMLPSELLVRFLQLGGAIDAFNVTRTAIVGRMIHLRSVASN